MGVSGSKASTAPGQARTWEWPLDLSAADSLLRRVREGAITPGTRSSDGLENTLLMVASRYDMLDDMKWLLKAGEPVNATNKGGRTPLLRAAMHNAFAVVQVLIAAGADVNAADTLGHTVLMYAVRHDDLPMVHYLLDCGAKVSSRMPDERTILYFASRPGHFHIIKLLLKHDAIDREWRWRALLLGAMEGDRPIEAIHALLASGGVELLRVSQQG